MSAYVAFWILRFQPQVCEGPDREVATLRIVVRRSYCRQHSLPEIGQACLLALHQGSHRDLEPFVLNA